MGITISHLQPDSIRKSTGISVRNGAPEHILLGQSQPALQVQCNPDGISVMHGHAMLRFSCIIDNLLGSRPEDETMGLRLVFLFSHEVLFSHLCQRHRSIWILQYNVL